MDYRNLSTYDKIEELRQYCPCQPERRYVAEYMTALKQDDTKTVEEYESFGDAPRKILMNKREYEQGLLFGFTEKKFNQYDWIENKDFQEVEKIEFPHRDGWAVMNYVTIGRGLNGVWTYGVSYSYNTGGGGFGISVWNKTFDSRKECLEAGLKHLMTTLEKESEDKDKYAKKVLKQAKSLFDTLTGRKAVQLSLF